MENALFPRPHYMDGLAGDDAIGRGYGRETGGFVPLT